MSTLKQLARRVALAYSIGALLAGVALGQTDDTESMGEVVVTAQKRAEALEEIPLSISVIGGEALERQRADNFQDLIALVPGFSINSNTRGVSRITLRGLNTGGVASTVGVYVDEVPFGSSSGLANGAVLSGDFDTFDMNRIEVLRGPQGTLYGASSLGGTIKYVPNAPSTDGFEGRLQGTMEDVEGGGMGYALTGVLNLPASETFAIRASGFYRSDEGYIDSIGNNPIPALQDPTVTIESTRVEEELNGAETYGGRVSALLEPSEAFSLNLTAMFQDINSDNSNRFEADPETLDALYGGSVVSRYHPEWTDIEYRVYSATINWDMGPVTLQSVTSYGEFTETFQRDIAVVPALGAPTAQLATLLFSTPGTTDMLLSGIIEQVTSTEKFTQELRLLSPESDSFEWLVGAYYTDEDSGIDPQNVFAVSAGTEVHAPGIPQLAEISLNSTYEELAFFANATWHITPKFDLSFGGRWSDNEQDASQVLDLFVLPAPVNFDKVSSSESPFTYSVAPRYELTETTSVYARVATGFRAGGPNILPPGAPAGTPAAYDSDEVTNYELGLKTANEAGTFSLDVAAFFLDWKDVQLLAVVNGVGINANGGTAESQGVEFTATASPGAGLSLTFTGAYTDAQLTEDTDPIVGGLDGDPLTFVPEWALGLGGDYEWAAFGDATAYVGGQVSYVGERPADFGNRDAAGNIREAEDYTTLDLRAGIIRERWSLELYGKNVTDEEGITDLEAPGNFPNGAVGISTIRPRTIGLALGARF
jgi:outer membrane receptor protein involved in Fe transport